MGSMDFRGEIRNRADAQNDRAAEVARLLIQGAILGSNVSTGGNVPTEPTPATWAVEDVDGNVVSGHYFMVGIDEVGDPFAPLAPPNN